MSSKLILLAPSGSYNVQLATPVPDSPVSYNLVLKSNQNGNTPNIALQTQTTSSAIGASLSGVASCSSTVNAKLFKAGEDYAWSVVPMSSGWSTLGVQGYSSSIKNTVATDGNGIFLAVEMSTGHVFRSADWGLTWTDISASITGLTFSAYNTQVFYHASRFYVNSGATGNIVNNYSTTGAVSWATAITTSFAASINGADANGYIFASDLASVIGSNAGGTWTYGSPPNGVSNQGITAAAYIGTTYYVFSGAQVAYSTNRSTWTGGIDTYPGSNKVWNNSFEAANLGTAMYGVTCGYSNNDPYLYYNNTAPFTSGWSSFKLFNNSSSSISHSILSDGNTLLVWADSKRDGTPYNEVFYGNGAEFTQTVIPGGNYAFRDVAVIGGPNGKKGFALFDFTNGYVARFVPMWCAAAISSTTKVTSDLTTSGGGASAALASSSVSISAISASLSTSVVMDAEVSAVASQSSALTTAINMSAAPVSVATAVTADLTTGGASAVVASVTSTSNVTATLTTSVAMLSVLTCTAAAPPPALTTSIKLASVVGATSSVSLALGANAALSASAVSTSSTTSALSSQINLAASAASTSSIAGSFSGTSAPLTSSCVGSSSTTAALTTAVKLAGSTNSVASTTASLGALAAQLAASSYSNSSTSASLSTTVALSSVLGVSASSLGAITTAVKLAGSVSSVSSTSASLGGLAASLASSISGKSTATAALSSTIVLLSALVAKTSIQGSASTSIKLSGVTTAISVVRVQLKVSGSAIPGTFVFTKTDQTFVKTLNDALYIYTKWEG